jgi:IS605 OrfB family transposase
MFTLIILYTIGNANTVQYAQTPRERFPIRRSRRPQPSHRCVPPGQRTGCEESRENYDLHSSAGKEVRRQDCRRKLFGMVASKRIAVLTNNHCISKQIVAEAKGTQRGIAVEELTGIHERVTVRKKQRAVLRSWAFHQLRTFLTYKAACAGVPLLAIDPRNTSRGCSACGYAAKGNRKTQREFVCLDCGFALHADLNAALNLRSRANRQVANRSELCKICCKIGASLCTLCHQNGCQRRLGNMIVRSIRSRQHLTQSR